METERPICGILGTRTTLRPPVPAAAQYRYSMNGAVTPYVLAGRIFSILGMGLTSAMAILFLVGGFWWWGLGATVAFFPFFGLIAMVEKWQSRHGMIGPEDHAATD